MLDAEAIFIYKTIKSLNSNVKIVTELVYQSNIDLLYDNDEICEIIRLKKKGSESKKIGNGGGAAAGSTDLNALNT